MKTTITHAEQLRVAEWLLDAQQPAQADRAGGVMIDVAACVRR
jgi:hypothetical protein